MKAIETKYDGYRFRSRMEARWAVFFKTAGIPYEYEKQGYELKSGRYLPDFFLPTIDTWFEVKGQIDFAVDIAKFVDLVRETKKSILIANTTPRANVNEISLWYWSSTEIPASESDARKRVFMSNIDFGFLMADSENAGSLWLNGTIYEKSDKFMDMVIYPLGNGPHRSPILNKDFRKAYELAQEARFEFGDTPE